MWGISDWAQGGIRGLSDAGHVNRFFADKTTFDFRHSRAHTHIRISRPHARAYGEMFSGGQKKGSTVTGALDVHTFIRHTLSRTYTHAGGARGYGVARR